eukprot:1153972-Pelagomonas_calceolata.AAC.2
MLCYRWQATKTETPGEGVEDGHTSNTGYCVQTSTQHMQLKASAGLLDGSQHLSVHQVISEGINWLVLPGMLKELLVFRAQI